MATVGDQLLQPENGWKRYDDADGNISHTGIWKTRTATGMHSGSNLFSSDKNSSLSFNFTGSKIRIISNSYPDRVPTIVTVDRKSYIYSSYAAVTSLENSQILQFELTGLPDVVHSVVLTNDSTFTQGTSVLTIDAIDIDETGEIKPYLPVVSNNVLLRVTMLDSSEREYRLPTNEIDGFVNWYTRTIGTGISCYALNDIVDNSKEYLSFEKIISFKVIPLKD